MKKDGMHSSEAETYDGTFRYTWDAEIKRAQSTSQRRRAVAILRLARGRASARARSGTPRHSGNCYTIAQSGPMAPNTTQRFSTQYYDSEYLGMDMYRYEQRIYAPRFHRFISTGPIGERGGLNLYGFCDNDPINKWDYLGLRSITVKKCHAYLYIGHTVEKRPIQWNFPKDGGAIGGTLGCWPGKNNPEKEEERWPHAPLHDQPIWVFIPTANAANDLGATDSIAAMGDRMTAYYMHNNSTKEQHLGSLKALLSLMWSASALEDIKKRLTASPHCCKVIILEVEIGDDKYVPRFGLPPWKKEDIIEKTVSGVVSTWKPGNKYRVRVSP